MSVVKSEIYLCCVLLALASCAARTNVSADLPISKVASHQVAGVCQGANMDADPALVSFAREAMDRELAGKLESEGLIDSRSGARLELCLEKIHLRSTLMTFLFYPVVHPDQLKVKVTLLNGDKILNTWHLNAENDAGGYMAAPGRERRFLMLVSLISRKVVHLLKKPLRKPA